MNLGVMYIYMFEHIFKKCGSIEIFMQVLPSIIPRAQFSSVHSLSCVPLFVTP